MTPKLLFLGQTLPFPPDTGVAVRSYNILRILARSFDVTALCFYRRRAVSSPERLRTGVAGLSELGETEAFPIPQEHARSRWLGDHVRSLLSGRVYTRYVYDSADFGARLRDLLQGGRFDLVHVDSLDLSVYLPLPVRVPVVCTHHNVESRLLRSRAAAEHSVVRRTYLKHQARLYEREEKHWCARVDLNVAVSEPDAAALRALAPEGRYAVAPNGVDTAYFAPRAGREQGVVFLGGTEWFPNRDALSFYAEEIGPLLRARGGNEPVRWVGRSTAAEQARFRERHGIEMTGYVDDIRPYVWDAACCVVPLRVGGGTRLKITTAWAMGKAVVSTSVGCEGLAAEDGENILIRDTPEAFAEAVGRVQGDADLRHRLGRNARETAVRLYSWDVIGARMLDDYSAVLQSSSREKAGVS